MWIYMLISRKVSKLKVKYLKNIANRWWTLFISKIDLYL